MNIQTLLYSLLCAHYRYSLRAFTKCCLCLCSNVLWKVLRFKTVNQSSIGYCRPRMLRMYGVTPHTEGQMITTGRVHPFPRPKHPTGRTYQTETMTMIIQTMECHTHP